MSKTALATVIASLALGGLLLAGCGGSAGKADSVVAQVGNSTITESTLKYWMATFIRGDFYQTIGRKAPAGLATDPPDYSACVSAAKTLAPSPASGKRQLSSAELGLRCHQLYQDARSEALSYLISVLWSVGQAAELGKKVSDQEVQQKLNRVIPEQYKTQQAFATYLTNKGWSLADMHYILKRNLLSQLTVADARQKASKIGGGQRAFVNVVVGRNAKWTSKTKCRASDLVWQCPGYRSTATTTPSPAVIFEEMGSR